MGDPRKARKQYEGPKHPWEASRLVEERIILGKYGLKNKKEIWKMQSIMKRFKRQAKALIARRDQQAEKEQALLMKKLARLGLLGKDAKIENVLGLTLDNIMKLRLQTAVYNKGLAKSIGQARQFIVHGHIAVGSRKINVPSYILESGEEDKISFIGGFTVSQEEKPLEKTPAKVAKVEKRGRETKRYRAGAR